MAGNKKLAVQVARMSSTLSNLEKAVSILPSTSQPRSYASAASGHNLLPPTVIMTPPNSSPSLSPIPELNTTRANARAKHQLPIVELNLQGTRCDTENAPSLQVMMNIALQTTIELKEVTCRGIVIKRNGRVSFVFKTEQQAQQVKEVEPWKNIIELDFAQARPITQERFKVKLSGVDKFKIGNPGKGEKVPDNVLQKVNSENNLTIQAIRLLGQSTDRRTT